MKGMKHVCDVMTPATSTDDRGQEIGADTVFLKGVPCSVEPLSASQLEAARQLYSVASHEVKFYGDPRYPVTSRHYLVVNGSRRFEIGAVLDVRQNGEEYKLTCGEVVA